MNVQLLWIVTLLRGTDAVFVNCSSRGGNRTACSFGGSSFVNVYSAAVDLHRSATY